MKTYVLTARPLPTVGVPPWQADLLKNASITVELRCSKMGRNNRRKILRLVMPELIQQFGHLCKIGGFIFQEPVPKADASAFRNSWSSPHQTGQV